MHGLQTNLGVRFFRFPQLFVRVKYISCCFAHFHDVKSPPVYHCLNVCMDCEAYSSHCWQKSRQTYKHTKQHHTQTQIHKKVENTLIKQRSQEKKC